MEKLISLLLCCMLITHFSHAKLKHVIKKSKTVKSLSQLTEGDHATLLAANGKSYPVIVEKADLEVEPSDGGVAAPAVVNPPCDGEAFDGTDRKAAKLNLSSAKVDTFQTLTALINTLPADDVIAQRNPVINTGSTSTRVHEEDRNAYVKKAWIYTLSREGDEDYHTIIGDTPMPTSATKYFNMEISGLPPAGNGIYAKLLTVRTTYKKFFGLDKACQGGYVNTFTKPVMVSFMGSLFFDQLHYEGHASIGHGNAKPASYWEVHPVSFIKFL